MKKILAILIVVILGMVSFKFTKAQTTVHVDDLATVLSDNSNSKNDNLNGMPTISSEVTNSAFITKVNFFGIIDTAYVFIAFNQQFQSVKNSSFELEKPFHISFASFNKNATEICRKIKDLLNKEQGKNNVKITDVNLMYSGSNQALSTVLVSFVNK